MVDGDEDDDDDDEDEEYVNDEYDDDYTISDCLIQDSSDAGQ